MAIITIISAAASAFVVLVVYYAIINPGFVSPLAKIPAAHWSCHYAPLWILAVSVFSNYGIDNMFSTLSSRPHSLRKRAVSNVYSKSFIHASRAAKAQTTAVVQDRLLPLLRAEPASSSTGVDVFPVFLACAMDLIAAYVFDLAGGTDFVRRADERDPWLALYLARAEHGFWPQELPVLTRLNIWNRTMCDEAQRRAQTADAGAEDRDEADEAVVLDALNAWIDREARTAGEDSLLFTTSISQRRDAVASEVMDHLLAGQETAGIALTYAAWHLSRSSRLQDELRAELLTLHSFPPPSLEKGSTVPDSKALDALPLLHAVVMETLRLHAPIPGPEPRRTPPTGCRIAGFTIPGDVRVACLAHTLHRDEAAFPDPEDWAPTRWLVEDVQKREMLRRFWAFGSGGRMCLGSNFAMNEMKYILAAMYTHFRTFVVDDAGITQEDAYTARPTGESLTLRFEPVDS
ncbi:N-acetyltryptophan 6-hydroxylase ivoC like protein [Verticillium longisporum]|nr:N-acetyltryptophan 6-hydroxylase ivoC like protein [Verticillium longisporum]